MITLPASKSIVSRYLVATFFSGTLPGDPFYEDNEDIINLQEALLEIYSDEEPIDYGDSPIDVGASGTALRFVTAVCASTKGADYVITGTPRLMQRPMLPLTEVLGKAGAKIESLGGNNCGPYRVTGDILKGGEFEIRGDISSQFISALMLVGPVWESGLKLSFTTPPVSRPYIKMTAGVLSKFGIPVKLDDTGLEIPHKKYTDPGDFKIEADWSSASFFYEACALGAENIELSDLISPEKSLQGDSITAEIFEKLGVKSKFTSHGADLEKIDISIDRIDIDMGDCPDLVLPFAVACLCNDIKFRISNISHLKLKESDRLKSLKEESRKLGFDIKIGEDYAEWGGEKVSSDPDPLIDTHDDHRVAMSFAMAALKTGRIRIQNPRVVEKSFMDFWNQLTETGLKCKEQDNVMIVEK